MLPFPGCSLVPSPSSRVSPYPISLLRGSGPFGEWCCWGWCRSAVPFALDLEGWLSWLPSTRSLSGFRGTSLACSPPGWLRILLFELKGLRFRWEGLAYKRPATESLALAPARLTRPGLLNHPPTFSCSSLWPPGPYPRSPTTARGSGLPVHSTALSPSA